MSEPITQFQAGELAVEVHSGTAEMGQAAAERAAAVIRDAVARTGRARAVFATGNSQFAFVQALRSQDVPWDRVTAFHLDEYVGIDADHPASFRRWIRERIEEPFQPERVHYIDGDAPDAEAECRRYEDLLREGPLDLICMGIGENGHIAFNEPNEADFADQRLARVITLTPESRAQQVGEGHFPDDAAVPATAISLTVPALLSGTQVLVCTPDQRKAAAVAAALRDEISPACPATILRTAGHATLFLDPESAGQLEVPVG
ncbi:glucosamine-6-phosphate deaminase [Jiangella sp. DSM 45060]|uniref:glucosamine-6-phosphate deaminase n=1 Tax=Jiangella sp. DSM 45060 TaxID=1798224 RepID=UPI00087D3106|nr:glucosamine-6-phosphate deaminase [Jiangella sp. DSM 45060]SDT35117.1 glucosamine-6-phosphate deaminase [Jiangella sp. DSM 45060]